MRKINAGLTRGRPSLTLKLRGYHIAVGRTGPGSLRVVLTPAVIELLGLRAGQRLRTEVNDQGIRLSVLRVASSYFAVPPRKRSGADRVRFERQWARINRGCNVKQEGGRGGLRMIRAAQPEGE